MAIIKKKIVKIIFLVSLILFLLALDWTALHDILRGEPDPYLEYGTLVFSAIVFIVILLRRQYEKFNYQRVVPLVKQLLIDLKPVEERLNIEVKVQRIDKDKIALFCEKNHDLAVFQKMAVHELSREPVEDVIAIYQKNSRKIEKKYFDKLLRDLGYNIHVLLSKNHGADYEAAINIGVYLVPGWKYLISFLRKLNTNLTVFLSKRFAPGASRLHVRIFEGKKHWYMVAHIDQYNIMNLSLAGLRKSHLGSGHGNYKIGTECFLDTLKYYFKEN